MNSHEQTNLGEHEFTRAEESGRAELLAPSNNFEPADLSKHHPHGQKNLGEHEFTRADESGRA